MKIKHLLATSLLVLSLSSFTFAEDIFEKDYFDNFQFGITQKEVMSRIKDKAIENTKEQVIYNLKDKTFGNIQKVYFFDENNKLSMVVIFFATDHKKPDEFVKDYKNVNQKLNELYGNPFPGDEIEFSNKVSLEYYESNQEPPKVDQSIFEDNSKLAKEILEEKVQCHKLWAKENFNIIHSLEKSNVSNNKSDEKIAQTTIQHSIIIQPQGTSTDLLREEMPNMVELQNSMEAMDRTSSFLDEMNSPDYMQKQIELEQNFQNALFQKFMNKEITQEEMQNIMIERNQKKQEILEKMIKGEISKEEYNKLMNEL